VSFGAFVAGTQIQGLLVLNYSWYVFQPWHGTLLIIAVLVFSVLFNTLLAQQLHLIEGAVLFVHIFGFAGIVATLWATSPIATSKEVWTTFYDPGWGNQGLSCLVGIVASVAPLLGADAAGQYSFVRLFICTMLTSVQRIWQKSFKMQHIAFLGSSSGLLSLTVE
jgi:choline transport protein